jgi:hypothetical protein
MKIKDAIREKLNSATKFSIKISALKRQVTEARTHELPTGLYHYQVPRITCPHLERRKLEDLTL